ncbi:uncharacterized protein TNCV_1932521 [Trichonephila clavipes]|nr:uncharacterized protein TNCV_1932521 [Trichonephila clavipes]
MKIDEIDERIIFDSLDQEVETSSSTVNSDRFGNKNMLINAHLSNLLNLTPVRNTTDIVGLRNLYDRAETQIRSLESLGVKGESYSNLLTPILLKQIPSELVLEFNRSQRTKGFDLSALLRFLHLEIRSRERASQINSHKLCHYSFHRKTEQKIKAPISPDNSLYVDDFLCGNVSVQAALTTCIESKQILEDASMDLRKWRTNSSELNQRLKNLNFEVDEHKGSLNTLIASKVLGVGWN